MRNSIVKLTVAKRVGRNESKRFEHMERIGEAELLKRRREAVEQWWEYFSGLLNTGEVGEKA